MTTAIVQFGEMERMAQYIAKSKLFGAKDESQAMSLMLLSQAEGMHPMCAIQDFDIVQGRPARKTHSILARFQAAGGSVEWEEISATRACGKFSHKQGGSLRVEWTFEQAKKVGLTGKDNWKNYPQAMLRARCIAEAVRAVWPAAIGGVMSVEEAQDASPVVDMGPAQVIRQSPTQIAQAAQIVQEERTEDIVGLIQALEQVAKEDGLEVFAAEWMNLSPQARKAIGAEEKDRLKALAMPKPESAWDEGEQA